MAPRWVLRVSSGRQRELRVRARASRSLESRSRCCPGKDSTKRLTLAGLLVKQPVGGFGCGDGLEAGAVVAGYGSR